jgi:hypothetical protein
LAGVSGFVAGRGRDDCDAVGDILRLTECAATSDVSGSSKAMGAEQGPSAARRGPRGGLRPSRYADTRRGAFRRNVGHVRGSAARRRACRPGRGRRGAPPVASWACCRPRRAREGQAGCRFLAGKPRRRLPGRPASRREENGR